MGLNHRLVLRWVTDAALGFFLLSALGVVLWVTDEFLGWNILPDWIDNYAQLIVVLFAMATGLAVGASLLCSMALIAESAAERAGIRDSRTPPGVWRILGILVVLFILGMVAFYRIDLYRKEMAWRRDREADLAEYESRVGQFQAALPGVVGRFPPSLLEAMETGDLAERIPELVTFLSAIQSSTAHRPEVVILTRASPPYRFCRYELRSRRDSGAVESLGRYYLEEQFYTSFPSEQELEMVETLFAGRATPLQSRLEGEVINNVRPGAWKPLHYQEQVVGLLVIRGDWPSRFGFFHDGQEAKVVGSGAR